MRNFTMEHVVQIWDDQHGSRVEVGPDPDGLGLLEIRYVNEENKAISHITLTRTEASLLVEGLQHLLEHPPVERKDE